MTAPLLLCAAALLLATPALFLGAECLLATAPLRRRRVVSNIRPSIAVVVPAHNESGGVAPTVETLRRQLSPEDRLIVVADNCQDDTAEHARRAGAEVWVRQDDERRGKGYALQHAFDRLAEEGPPEVIVCVDADTLPDEGAVMKIVTECFETQRPIQSAYLMTAPEGSGFKSLVSGFAVLVKNYVRPRGLQRVGSPCLISGSGFALPWAVVERVPQPVDHIVEDMRYTTDLAINGVAPLPSVGAFFRSKLPSSDESFTTQRTRWEHGHLSTIQSETPRLLWDTLRNARPSSLILALELGVPPLSLFLPFWVFASVVVGLLGWLTAATLIPALLLLAAGLLVFLGLFLSWAKFGRQTIPIRELAKAPAYMLSKAPMYLKYARKPQTDWVKTSRDSGAEVPSSSSGV